MGEHALTVKTVRDGPVCALILSGDLDLTETDGFLGPAALAVDNRTERLILDLAGVTFLDCAGVRALAMAASFAPSGCPVIIRSLSPMARRILELLGSDVEASGKPVPRHGPQEGPGLGNQSADTWPYRSRAVLAATGGDPDG
jgi:anti-anti-sigma factor